MARRPVNSGPWVFHHWCLLGVSEAFFSAGFTGLILDLPKFNQTCEIMQQADFLHALIALDRLAMFLGHLHVATLGVKDVLDVMIFGDAVAGWAKRYHHLWYEEIATGLANIPVKPEPEFLSGIPATN